MTHHFVRARIRYDEYRPKNITFDVLAHSGFVAEVVCSLMQFDDFWFVDFKKR